jgi:hypothetical protein
VEALTLTAILQAAQGFMFPTPGQATPYLCHQPQFLILFSQQIQWDHLI